MQGLMDSDELETMLRGIAEMVAGTASNMPPAWENGAAMVLNAIATSCGIQWRYRQTPGELECFMAEVSSTFDASHK